MKRVPIIRPDHIQRERVTSLRVDRKFVMCDLSSDALSVLLSLLFESSFIAERQEFHLDVSSVFTSHKAQALQELTTHNFLRIVDSVCIMSKTRLKQAGLNVHVTKSPEQKALNNLGKGVTKELAPERHASVLLIIGAYNEVRCEFHRRQGTWIPEPVTMTNRNTTDACTLLDVLNRHDIKDYSAYLYIVFERFGWQFVPSLAQAAAPECLDAWTTNKGKAFEAIAWRDKMKLLKEEHTKLKALGKVQSIYRDLFPSIEQQKASLLAQDACAICMADVNSTLGYHPKSEYCARCPARESCKKQIHQLVHTQSQGVVDILALRLGSVALEELQRKLDAEGVALDLSAGWA